MKDRFGELAARTRVISQDPAGELYPHGLEKKRPYLAGRHAVAFLSRDTFGFAACENPQKPDSVKVRPADTGGYRRYLR